MLGQAGDRDNASVRELVQQTLAFAPDRILIKDLPKYHRGRPPGEMVALIASELELAGVPSDRFAQAETEFEAVQAAA